MPFLAPLVSGPDCVGVGICAKSSGCALLHVPFPHAQVTRPREKEASFAVDFNRVYRGRVSFERLKLDPVH